MKFFPHKIAISDGLSPNGIKHIYILNLLGGHTRSAKRRLEWRAPAPALAGAGEGPYSKHPHLPKLDGHGKTRYMSRVT